MIYKQIFAAENDCYKKNEARADSRYTSYQTRGASGVMWHSTGANNPWLKRYVAPDDGEIGKNSYGNDWNRPGLDVCVHGFIGKLSDGRVAFVQTLPDSYRGWHAGIGRNGSANNSHFSFEMCEDDLQDAAYFCECWRTAVEFTAQFCAKHSLDPLADGVIIDHADGHKRGIASNHGDVEHWSKRHGKTMADARREVAYYMKHGYHEGEQLPGKEKTEMRYKTIDDVPGWAKAETQELIDAGALKGKGGDAGLDVTEDMLRTMIINLRYTKQALGKA